MSEVIEWLLTKDPTGAIQGERTSEEARIHLLRSVNHSIYEGDCFVGGIDDKIVGAMTLYDNANPNLWGPEDTPDQALYVRGMFVDRKAAGRGIGAQMLQWAAGQTLDAGRTRLRLEVWENNDKLQEYFEQLGFSRVPREKIARAPRHAIFERALATEAYASTFNDELMQAARGFFDHAISVLKHQHVIPLPVFRPYLEVGRDYFGPDLAGPEIDRFTAAIGQLHPKFAAPVASRGLDFPGPYVYQFLELCIARLTKGRREYSSLDPIVDRAMRDIQNQIMQADSPVACCRVVSHMSTITKEPIRLGNVSVVPLVGAPWEHSSEVRQVINSVIPDAESVYGNEPPSSFNPPESVVVIRGAGNQPYEATNELSREIERILMVIRLLEGATCGSIYEVRGETSRGRRGRHQLVLFQGNAGSILTGSQAKRTAVLDVNHADKIGALGEILRSVDVPKEGMAFTSFSLALQRFQRSYHVDQWFDQLIDLTTAFEGALSGTDKYDVLLRLRMRSAVLLSTEVDPVEAIFKDVGHLYDLRSSLIHGAALKQKDLVKNVNAISTVPAGTPFGVAIDLAVDRIRDLVRRSLLARICLADGADPIWPLASDVGVDVALTNDATRTLWRDAWHARLHSIGAAEAAQAARPAKYMTMDA